MDPLLERPAEVGRLISRAMHRDADEIEQVDLALRAESLLLPEKRRNLTRSQAQELVEWKAGRGDLGR